MIEYPSRATDRENSDLRILLSETQDNERRLEDEIDSLRAQLAEAQAERDAARQALRRFQHYGCPDCGGDCGSANPPVSCCIMQEARAALQPKKDTQA